MTRQNPPLALCAIVIPLFCFLSACTDDKGVLDRTECLDMNVAASCYTWAKKLEKHDLVKAKQIHEKTCNMDHTEGCIRLGDLLSKKKPRDAHSWYKRACDAGNSRACVKQAEILLKLNN